MKQIDFTVSMKMESGKTRYLKKGFDEDNIETGEDIWTEELSDAYLFPTAERAYRVKDRFNGPAFQIFMVVRVGGKIQ